MTFQKYLQTNKTLVDNELQTLFQKKHKDAKHVDPHLDGVVGQIEEFTMRGGKRLRPFLCWLGYYTVINPQLITNNSQLLSAMLSIELFQTSMLIHDDIIDEDKTRRGGPTVHESFKLSAVSCQLSASNKKHFGASLAILAGDLALIWADESMGSNNIGIIKLYQAMKEETLYGQVLDVCKLQANEAVDKNKIDTLKTAYYSVVRPLQIGAALAGGGKKLLQDLESYGLLAGRAFQLSDDCLDGAITCPELIQLSTPLLQKSKAILSGMKIPNETKILLAELADFVVSRKS